MAIIYSYPEKTLPAGGDFLVITDSEQAAPNKNRTKSLTIDNLKAYIQTSASGVSGSGTVNQIPMFTPDSTTLGDSIMKQAGTSSNPRIEVGAGTSFTGASVSTQLLYSTYLQVTKPSQDATFIADTGTFLTSLSLPNNVKLKIGTTSTQELEIYHDGVNSIINEQGSGDLLILSNNEVEIRSGIGSANDTFARFTKDGPIELYYNNQKRLSTTNTGINVTQSVGPSSATDTGTSGDIIITAAYIYVCIATNTWKRVAIATF